MAVRNTQEILEASALADDAEVRNTQEVLEASAQADDNEVRNTQLVMEVSVLAGTGLIYAEGCVFGSDGEDRVIPSRGDRSAYGVTNYEDDHADDIRDGTETRHLPAPSADGSYPRDNGATWATQLGLPLTDLNSYARGSIIRGGATDWEAYAAETDGQILVGDGVDIVSVAVSGDASLANTGAVTIDGLDASNVANVANDQTTPGLPVVFAVAIAGGAAADTDITIVGKHRVIDAWAQHTGGIGEASDTIQVKNGANAITDAMDWSGADNTIVRAASIDDANSAIADGGTLRVTTVDADAGTDVGAGIVYVLAIPVA